MASALCIPLVFLVTSSFHIVSISFKPGTTFQEVGNILTLPTKGSSILEKTVFLLKLSISSNSYQSRHTKTKSSIQQRKSVMLFLKTISSSNGQKVTEVYFQSSFPPLSKESAIILSSRHTVTQSASQKNPDKCGKIMWKTPFFLTTGSKKRKVEKTRRVLHSRTFTLMFLIIFHFLEYRVV